MPKTRGLGGLGEFLNQQGVIFEPIEEPKLVKGRVHKPKICNRPVREQINVSIPPSYEDVPMMYRAQFSGRCNLMYSPTQIR